MQISRLILYVQDVALLTAFYRTHFELSVAEEIENEWAVLTDGGFEIALHLAGRPYRNGLRTSGRQSNAKIVFSVSHELPQLRERLIKGGVKMRGIKRYPGFPLLLCDGEDPEGNVFQLAQSI